MERGVEGYYVIMWGDKLTSGKENLFKILTGEMSERYRINVTLKIRMIGYKYFYIGALAVNGIDDHNALSHLDDHNALSHLDGRFAIAVCFEMGYLKSYIEALAEIGKLKNSGKVKKNTHILLVATPPNKEKENPGEYCTYETNLAYIDVDASSLKVRFVDCSYGSDENKSAELTDMVSNLISDQYVSVKNFISDNLLGGDALEKALDKAQQQYVDNTYLEFRKEGKRQVTDKRKPTDIKTGNGADKLLELLCGEGSDDKESYKFLVCKQLFDLDTLFPNKKAETIVQAIKVELLADAIIRNDLSDQNEYSKHFKKKIIPSLSKDDLINLYDLLLTKVMNNEHIDLARLNFNVYSTVKGHSSGTLNSKAIQLMTLCNNSQEKN